MGWGLTNSKKFNVSSAYQGMKESRYHVFIHRVWKMKVLPRMKVFPWLVYYNKILTAENLAKRGWNMPSTCVLCRQNNESIKHMFFECVFSLTLYTRVADQAG